MRQKQPPLLRGLPQNALTPENFSVARRELMQFRCILYSGLSFQHPINRAFPVSQWHVAADSATQRRDRTGFQPVSWPRAKLPAVPMQPIQFEFSIA